MSRALGYFWDMPYHANLRFQFIRRDTIILSTEIREDSFKARPLITYFLVLMSPIPVSSAAFNPQHQASVAS